jgi:hypothetical protein
MLLYCQVPVTLRRIDLFNTNLKDLSNTNIKFKGPMNAVCLFETCLQNNNSKIHINLTTENN